MGVQAYPDFDVYCFFQGCQQQQSPVIKFQIGIKSVLLFRKVRNNPFWWLGKFLSSCFLSNFQHFVQRSPFYKLWRFCWIFLLGAFVTQNTAINAVLGAVYINLHLYCFRFSGEKALAICSAFLVRLRFVMLIPPPLNVAAANALLLILPVWRSLKDAVLYLL